MKVEELKKMYDELLKLEDTDDGILDFKEALLSSDDENVLEFHLKIIQDPNEEYMKRDLLAFFSDRDETDKVDDFLYRKYQQVYDNVDLKADFIELFGHLRGQHAKQIAIENIDSSKEVLRYKSIIVLGWVGDFNDLSILNNRLLNDPDPQLRSYSATAMRQIWYNYPKVKDGILQYLKKAIEKEESIPALEGMIVTVQDLLKKKLGLKESKYGDLTGDTQLAKIKTIGALKNY